MKYVLHLMKSQFLAIAIFMIIAIGAPHVFAQNGVMMQYFHWYYPGGGILWDEVAGQADELAKAGITALWLPPAYKGASQNDVGYGVYDLYDLGEFDQKGMIPTKYGTKDQYLNAISAAHRAGIQIYADVVFNHRMGADFTEKVKAVRVAGDNRNDKFGEDIWIQAWTGFDFSKRSDKYSSFKWRWYCFDGTDWAEDLREMGQIYKFRGIRKAWDLEVDTENHNYDYLMGADVDFENPDVQDELKRWGQWVVAHTKIDGFRIDAVKHIEYGFIKEWLEHVRSATGKELFAVGEFWSVDIDKLNNYIVKTGGSLSLFDTPLHYNFNAASKAGGTYDMSKLMDNTLMVKQPGLAVTLVENHDTQPCQALESPVEDWFKPLAYAFILLRKEGYPNIFYPDYFGAHYSSSDNKCGQAPGGEVAVNMVSHKFLIDNFLEARKKFAYGPQRSYLNHRDIIGWTRMGNRTHPGTMAVIMSDGEGGAKWMDTGKPETTYIDMTGHLVEPVITNQKGWGEFPVKGGSVSVWVEQSGPSGAVGEPINGGSVSVQVEQSGPSGVVGEVDVAFTCHKGKTFWGQNVYVVGSIPELGDWDIDKAKMLGPENYPDWKKTLSHLPPDTDVEWKCIKRDGAGNVEWQPGDNNKFTTPHSGTGTTSGSF